MADMPALLRHLILLNLMMTRRYGMTIHEMMDETGAQERVIRRDLKHLIEAGIPLVSSIAEFGRKHWKLAETARLPRLEFNYTEALSLYMGRRFFDPLIGTEFWDGAESAFQKIRACFKEDTAAYIDKMARSFYRTTSGISDYSDKGKIIDALMTAIEDRVIITMSYQSQRATEPVSYVDIHPQGLVQHRHSLYLVALDGTLDEIRHYKVDRMFEVNVTRMQSQRHKNFDMRAHLAGSFGIHFTNAEPVTIRVRFASVVARYVQEKKFHPTQQATRGPDGSVILTFELSDLVELKSWILGFGANAVVLEPVSLRNEIIEDLRTGLEAYAEQAASELPATDGQAASAKRPANLSGKKPRRSRPR